ncbi:SDR family oxidoreductase [Nonomuraea sp. NPDC059023]|uniref:SDR family oxidoreductase n=1 Tax=unclassified Nonomuraea TaxID=2593643 RepID=UPI0036A47CBC
MTEENIMTILLTGGTGTLGRLVLPPLRRTGAEVRVLTRNPRPPEDGVTYVKGDLLTGEGVAAAVDGADLVLHLAGGAKGDDVATRNLTGAARAAGAGHIVFISAIGADRVPLGWFRNKLAAERAVIESGIPWTILRAAQFHDLALKVATAMARMPVVPVPGGLRFQPVDARDVAERLVELVQAEPAGLVADLAGPAVYGMGDLVRAYLATAGKRRLMLPVRMPGKAGRAYRAGENLTLTGGTTGGRTWEAFLGERA